ncbi:MAG: gliding motility-associated C-terminal domain-containing protein, partial [Bacteroidota bacterium]
YGQRVLAGPYPISGGVVELTIVDVADASCRTIVRVGAPASCSDACEIRALVDNVLCDDNGTPSDGSDDTFSFDLLVTGGNTGASWESGTLSGAYGQRVLAGPYPISGGVVELTIVDVADVSCRAIVRVGAPASCSDACEIRALVDNVLCDDNGTPSDGSDDTFSFELLVTGVNTGASWESGTLSGAYGQRVLAGPYPISGGVVELTIVDVADGTCASRVVVPPPPVCSTECPFIPPSFNQVLVCDALANEQTTDTLFLQNDQGCDSLIIVETTFVARIEELLALELCEGESIEINGIRYDEQTPLGEQVFTSQTGCDSVLNIELDFQKLDLDWSVDDPICDEATGRLRLQNIRGGTAPYELLVGDATPVLLSGDAFEWPNLEPGRYTFSLTDREGCRFEETFEVRPAVGVVVALGRDQRIILGDSIGLFANTNGASAQFQWSSVDTLSCDDCQRIQVAPTQNTVYEVVVTDANGCTARDAIRIEVDRDLEVFIPNVFSPNGDGVNDLLTVFGKAAAIQEIEIFQVFDRWGNLVFENRSMAPNQEFLGWDGRFKGEELPAAVFVYYATVVFIDGRQETFSGDVTLLR